MNLRCPICKEALLKQEKCFKCVNHHSFDIARQGYVNLLISNGKAHGDNKLLVSSRTSFLEKGYYQNLQEKITQICRRLNPDTLIDCGCGQGYYTNAIKTALPDCEIIGIDISKEALKTASRNGKASQYITASSFDMPLFDESADCCLNIFTPIAADEIVRILKPHGKMIVVSPGIKHLFELKKAVYDEPYLNEPLTIEHACLKRVSLEELNSVIHLNDPSDIQALFSMTPYYYKTSQADKQKLENLKRLSTETQFIIQIFEKTQTCAHQ